MWIPPAGGSKPLTAHDSLHTLQAREGKTAENNIQNAEFSKKADHKVKCSFY